MKLITSIISATLLVYTTGKLGNDPADSWLVYGKLPGNNSRVLSVNATWIVPSFPQNRNGNNAPGWWFGIESQAADVLIQPILAYGDGTPDFTIFTGLYDWRNGGWYQSNTETVNPNDIIEGSVTYSPSTQTYQQCIRKVNNGKGPICTRVQKSLEYNEVFTDVYFVVEHQPNSCNENPANGNIIFTNIQVQWENGAIVTPSMWEIKQFKPACNSQGKVLNASSVEFTWATSD